MKRRIAIAGAFLAAMGMLGAWMASTEAASERLAVQRIGFVNLMEIQTRSEPVNTQVNRAMEEAREGLKEKIAEAESLMKDKDKLIEESRNPSLLSEERKDAIKQEAQRLDERLGELEYQINRQIEQQVDAATVEASETIMSAIKTVADSRGYAMVLTDRSIIYAAPSADLTPLVIQYLNEREGR